MYPLNTVHNRSRLQIHGLTLSNSRPQIRALTSSASARSPVHFQPTRHPPAGAEGQTVRCGQVRVGSSQVHLMGGLGIGLA
eukprot:1095705-Prymnesium_polylepis.1